ncbi:hypothetical protein J14TS2_00230 [Bacillus sp. J14TS2]|nr:hypothetical protein J14TS2_00230 [Bacillus sp. J14TS2]
MNLSKTEILEFVSIGETIAYGKPSGLDAATVVSGQLTYFQKYGYPKNLDFLHKMMGTATDDTTRYLNQLGI